MSPARSAFPLERPPRFEYVLRSRYEMAPTAKASVLLFAFFTLFYFVSMPGCLQISDSEYSAKTAQAIARHGTMEIEATPEEAGYVFRREGRAYSKFGIGLALIWVPFVAVADSVARATGLAPTFVAHFVLSTYSIFFGAGCCVLFHLLLVAMGVSRRHALLVTLALGIGTICWKYSVYDFSEIAQTFLLLAATYAALRNTSVSVALMAAYLSFLVFVKVAAVIYIPAFVSYSVWLNRRTPADAMRKVLTVAVVGAVFAGVLLWLNYVRFGNPFESGYGGQASEFSATIPSNVLSLLVSPEKGLFLYSPILLFAVLACRPFCAEHRPEAWLFGALIALNLCFHALYVYFEGGWSWGPRFQVVITPFLLLPAAVALDRRPTLRWVFLPLLAVSVVVQVAGVLQNDREYFTIRQVLLKDRSQPTPPPIAGHLVILKHKLLRGDSVYTAREFGLQAQETLDASSYSTFQGLNLWYVQVARRLDLEFLKVTPWIVSPVLLFLLVILLKTAVADDRILPRVGEGPVT